MSKIIPTIFFVLIINCALAPLSIINCFAQAPACDVPPITNCCAAIGGGAADSHFTMYPNDATDNINLTFDSFGEYLSGIAKYGATTLRLTVATGPGGCTCRWILHTNEDNFGNVVPPAAAANEWAKLIVYGSPLPAVIVPPVTGLLQVRVRNACSTSDTGPGFVTIASTADFRCIIDDACTSGTLPDNGLHPDNDAGVLCLPNVNGAGSYLTNPGEYTFIIDYQVIPKFTFTPGIYQITVRYCLRNGS